MHIYALDRRQIPSSAYATKFIILGTIFYKSLYHNFCDNIHLLRMCVVLKILKSPKYIFLGGFHDATKDVILRTEYFAIKT